MKGHRVTEPVKLEYAVGDICYINIGDNDLDGKPITTVGNVVNVFTLPHHPRPFYIIEVASPYWMHLETRDALLMADDPDQVLPIWRRDPTEEEINE